MHFRLTHIGWDEDTHSFRTFRKHLVHNVYRFRLFTFEVEETTASAAITKSELVTCEGLYRILEVNVCADPVPKLLLVMPMRFLFILGVFCVRAFVVYASPFFLALSLAYVVWHKAAMPLVNVADMELHYRARLRHCEFSCVAAFLRGRSKRMLTHVLIFRLVKEYIKLKWTRSWAPLYILEVLRCDVPATNIK